ncbi:MAG: BrnT family toxin [Candidatus Omnitrophica bacterium]|nr:BrnT family toxin [Candidatus Omnitrophota bacterium]
MDRELSFIWDPRKEFLNIYKHRVNFVSATKVFNDQERKICTDTKHSDNEERFFCAGKVDGKVLTVRFAYRCDKIRIIGAGYWRKGVRLYEEA